MARPAGVDSADTRDAILDGALVVFSRDGFSSASLGEVAALAGITKGAIYWHFSSKAKLFRGVIDRIGRMFREQVLARALVERDAGARVETMVRAYIDFVRGNPQVCVFLVQAMLDRDPAHRTAADRVFAQSSGVVAVMMEDAGVPFARSPEALADAFLAGLIGARVLGGSDGGGRADAVFAELEAQMTRRLTGADGISTE